MSEPETRYAYDTSVAPAASPADGLPLPETVAVVGRGRVGTALARALRAAGVTVEGPLGRNARGLTEVVLLCVPDNEIASAAAALVTDPRRIRFVGHVSGATGLSALNPAREAGFEVFGLHPLQTFSDEVEPLLTGAGCAIAGSSASAVALARELAARLGMSVLEIDDAQRASYHAAASIASNFLVTLEAAAEAVAAGAGFAPEEARALLAPLVRQTVENWATHGPEAALTGPVARGDETTVAAQRAAVGEADASLLPLFDALAERTRALATGDVALEVAA